MNYYIYYWKDIDYIHGDLAPETTKELDRDYIEVSKETLGPRPGKDIEKILETIYMKYNNPEMNPLATPEGQEKLKTLGIGHTSM